MKDLMFVVFIPLLLTIGVMFLFDYLEKRDIREYIDGFFENNDKVVYTSKFKLLSAERIDEDTYKFASDDIFRATYRRLKMENPLPSNLSMEDSFDAIVSNYSSYDLGRSSFEGELAYSKVRDAWIKDYVHYHEITLDNAEHIGSPRHSNLLYRIIGDSKLISNDYNENVKPLFTVGNSEIVYSFFGSRTHGSFSIALDMDNMTKISIAFVLFYFISLVLTMKILTWFS